MSDFLRREIFTDVFYHVMNYVRNLIMAKKSFKSELSTDQLSDYEYHLVQLKLYLLVFDSKFSTEQLAKSLSCDREIVTSETLMNVISTKKRVMSGTLQHKIYFFSGVDIEDDTRLFYERCVKVLSKVSKKDYSDILAYKTTDGRKKFALSENQSLLSHKKKITFTNLEPAV